METNRQRRGAKGKLGISIYRAPKPSSLPYTNKLKLFASPTMASFGSVSDKNGFFSPAPNKKAPPLTKKEGGDWFANQIGDQECVDNRAATYISYVQERFRLEQMECDKMC